MRGNITDVQFKTGKTVIACMPFNIAIQGNFLAFPDDTAGNADLPVTFNETGLLNAQNLLFITDLESDRAIKMPMTCVSCTRKSSRLRRMAAKSSPETASKSRMPCSS